MGSTTLKFVQFSPNFKDCLIKIMRFEEFEENRHKDVVEN
jgi:hypothetical protein